MGPQPDGGLDRDRAAVVVEVVLEVVVGAGVGVLG
jgi:hypothetical protein